MSNVSSFNTSTQPRSIPAAIGNCDRRGQTGNEQRDPVGRNSGRRELARCSKLFRESPLPLIPPPASNQAAEKPTLTENLRVLYVGEKPEDVATLESALKQARFTRFSLERSECLAAAQKKLKKQRFDVLLVNLGPADCPDCGMLRTVSWFRAHYRETPVVVLADAADRRQMHRVVSAGAQDYVLKEEAHPMVLERVLRHAVQRHSMVRQLHHTNELLRQKNRDVQTTNELLDRKNARLAQLYQIAHEFVDHASHEFRTPLTVIKEFATIIRDGLVGKVNQKQAELLEVISGRVDDLARIVDDLLDVSRLKTGMVSIWRRRGTVPAIYDHVRPLLERKALEKNVSLRPDFQDSLPEVYCDPEKIGRVLVNLVINAIKFCKPGGSVVVWADAQPEAHEVRLGVTDDGPGIAPDDLKAIFARFRQAQGADRGGAKGFGLGLSIAKDLVALNLGKIEVESEVGRGSTFVFSVPDWDPVSLGQRYLRGLAAAHHDSVPATLASVVCTHATESRVADALDGFLQREVRATDLVIPAGQHRWLVLARCDEHEIRPMFERIERARSEFNRGPPGCQLPEFDLSILGTWRIPEDSQELMRQFREEQARCARPWWQPDDREELIRDE